VRQLGHLFHPQVVEDPALPEHALTLASA
jgi:hypothetical protein